MPNIKFYRQSQAERTQGAITFKTAGGISVGTGTSSADCATLVEFIPKTTSGTSIGTLKLNGVEYELYYQPNSSTYVGGDGISVSNEIISLNPATDTTYGGIKLKLNSSTLEIST